MLPNGFMNMHNILKYNIIGFKITHHGKVHFHSIAGLYVFECTYIHRLDRDRCSMHYGGESWGLCKAIE